MHRRIPNRDEELRREIGSMADELRKLTRPQGDFLHGISQSSIRARAIAAERIRVRLRGAQTELLRRYGAEQEREDTRIRKQRYEIIQENTRIT